MYDWPPTRATLRGAGNPQGERSEERSVLREPSEVLFHHLPDSGTTAAYLPPPERLSAAEGSRLSTGFGLRRRLLVREPVREASMALM